MQIANAPIFTPRSAKNCSSTFSPTQIEKKIHVSFFSLLSQHLHEFSLTFAAIFKSWPLYNYEYTRRMAEFLVFNLAWVPPRFRELFSLNRHFPKNAESVGDVPASTPMGAAMQGKTGIARKEHLSRPTSSFAYLARGEYRVIFVGRSNRRIVARVASSKEKLRGQGVVRLCLEAECECTLRPTDQPYLLSESGRVANCSTYLPANPGCGNPPIPPVISTSVSLAAASKRCLPATFFLRTRAKIPR